MNLIDATVISIDSKPELKYDYWFVDCTITAYGHESKTQAVFKDELAASIIKVGDTITV
jgi:hypothetical protein